MRGTYQALCQELCSEVRLPLPGGDISLDLDWAPREGESLSGSVMLMVRSIGSCGGGEIDNGHLCLKF